jgi:NitT/TauT family transport system permease protein
VNLLLAVSFSVRSRLPDRLACFLWVLGNLKITDGFAFTGEFVAATRGLGYLLSFAQSTYNAALMFALILLILVVVLLIFGVAGRLEKYLLRWN